MHQQTTPRAVFTMAIMAAAIATLPPSVWAAEPAPAHTAARAFSIAAGPLSPALSRFAGQSGLTFSSDPALTANMSTRGLQGSYSVADGFARLLEGSGLEAVSPSAGVYVLRKLAAPAQEAAMPLVTVTGQLNSVSTEGSGSYAGGPSKTAMRMDLSVRDTPQSVTVITRAQLDDMGLLRLDDVLTQTTGIMVGQQDTERSSFYARGFEISNVQVDGMPQGANSPLSDTILYDRIDVVRGANGLMGGTGDPSATINMVRKRPARGYQASAGLILGRWDSHRAELDVSAPLNAAGSVRGRAALAYQERDSHMTMYHERKTVGMAIVEADLGANTSLTAGVDFQHNRPTGATYGAVPYWNADGSLARLPRSFSLTTPWSTWANEQETFFTSLEQRYAHGWKLHLGYARTTSRINTTVAYGGSGYPDPATGQGMGLWSGVWGEGVSVNDNFDAYATGPLSLFGRRHTLIAGWNGSNQSSGTLGGNAAIAYPGKIPDYRHWTGNIPRPNFHPDGTHSDSVKRLAGAYVAGRFNLAAPLNVIAGARVSNYRTETRDFDAGGKQTATSGYAETRDEITPYVGVVFDVSEQLSAYASYTTLFNPQSSKDRNNRFLDPESGTNTELGLKGEFFDGRLNASGAVFRTLKKNLAEIDRTVPAGFLLPDGSMAYVANGDGVTARGVEFDVAGQPMPGLNVNAGLTLLKAEDASGKRAVTTQPRRLLRLTASYALGGALQGVKVGGGVVAQSGIYSESWYGRPHAAPGEAPANVVQGGYALLNAMGSYDISKQLSAQLNISNLLDRKYYRNVGFYDGVYWGEPRNISLTLRAKF